MFERPFMADRVEALNGIGMDDDLITEVVGIYGCMEYTNIRADTDEMNFCDAAFPKTQVKVSSGKGTITCLINPVICLFCSFLHRTVQLTALCPADIVRWEQRRFRVNVSPASWTSFAMTT